MTTNWEGIDMTLEAAIYWERTMLFSLLQTIPSTSSKDICYGALTALREVDAYVVNSGSAGSDQRKLASLLLQGAINSRKAVEFAVTGNGLPTLVVNEGGVNTESSKASPCVGDSLTTLKEIRVSD